MKISIKISINQKKGTTLKILKILKISHFEAGGFPAKFGVNIYRHTLALFEYTPFKFYLDIHSLNENDIKNLSFLADVKKFFTDG